MALLVARVTNAQTKKYHYGTRLHCAQPAHLGDQAVNAHAARGSSPLRYTILELKGHKRRRAMDGVLAHTEAVNLI